MNLLPNNLRCLGCVALLLVLGSACGTTDDGKPGTAAKPIAEADLYPMLAQGICDNVGPCCIQAKLPVDAAGCKATLTAQIKPPAYSPSNVRYDAQAAEQCLKAYLAEVRSCTRTDEPPACKKIWQGLLAPGQTCTDDRECSSVAGGISTCVMNGNALTGVCTQDIRGVAGTPCDCTTSGNSSWCRAAGSTAGAPPAAVGTCYTADGLYCDTSANNGQSAVCKKTGMIGDPCNFDSCPENAYCSQQNGASTC